MGNLYCLPCCCSKDDDYSRRYNEARTRCDRASANYWQVRKIDSQIRRNAARGVDFEDAYYVRFDTGIEMDERVLPYLQEWPMILGQAGEFYAACVAYWLQSILLYRLGQWDEALRAADMAARSAALNLKPPTAEELRRKNNYYANGAEEEAASRAAYWQSRIDAFAASRDDMRAAIKAAGPAGPSHDCYGRPLAEAAGQI